MSQYWAWWVLSLALAGVTLGFFIALRRPLGVSGSWARIVMWRNDNIIEKAEAPLRENPAMLKDALMKATIEQFGEERVREVLEMRKRQGEGATQPPPQAGKIIVRTKWTEHLFFLFMLVAGGTLSAWLSGRLSIQMDLGNMHKELFGSGVGYFITLFVGGILIGFGTQLGGGCTSGHGLSGVSRLVPSSIIATITFFGAAVAVSIALKYMGGMG